MLNKILSILFIFFININVCYSQEYKFSILNQNEAAPFAGVLYNPEANGKLLTLVETSSITLKLKLNQQEEKLKLNFQKEKQEIELRLKSEIDLEKEKNKIFANSLKETQNLVQNPPIQWDNILIGTGVGVVVGIAITVTGILLVK